MHPYFRNHIYSISGFFSWKLVEYFNLFLHQGYQFLDIMSNSIGEPLRYTLTTYYSWKRRIQRQRRTSIIATLAVNIDIKSF